MNDATPETTKETILVVEDDRALREGLAMNLRLHGYNALAAADGEEGMRMAFDRKPDLILLDIMLPRWTGLDILEELRKHDVPAPVLILSARGRTPDKVEGLNLGADDYMTKPFDVRELIARIAALLRRRRSGLRHAPDLSLGDLVVERATRTVRLQGNEVPLSAKEFDLLCLLASSPDQVFDRDTILERVWGWDYEGTRRTVDNFVAGLRKKLRAGRHSPYIHTVPRVGYTVRIHLPPSRIRRT